ncbi:laccase [Mycena vulgaris]|nr:laccase [Mycena vulgaris]
MGFKLAATLVLLPFIVGQVRTADVFYDIPVTNAVVAPDGFPRSAIQMGTFPGMMVIASKGDVLHLNVSNELHDSTMRRSTSIHWHGIFQDRTASEDGPAFVNQCQHPSSFPSCAVIPTPHPDDPQKDLWDVDDETTVITLADWYHSPAEGLMAQFKLDGHEPVPDSGLINGVGRYVGGPEVPWSVINVEAGKRYRLRVINISAFSAYTFSIDGHTLDVIETDGIATVPLYPAQRYSVVLHANSVVDNYWVRAPMVNSTVDKDNVKAILRYAGAPIQDPVTSAVVIGDPVPAKGGPGGAAPLQEFELAFDAIWEINGIVYTPPTLPTLLKIINGATVASDFNVSEHTFILVKDEVVELHIHGSDHGITHPFHLHGHAFDIVKSASGPTNYVNPPRRDVIGVEQGGVVIRFRADNPGPWFLHCHIDWHLEAGLAVVFAEAPAEEREGPQTEIITPQWLDLCPSYYALPEDEQ